MQFKVLLFIAVGVSLVSCSCNQKEEFGTMRQSEFTLNMSDLASLQEQIDQAYKSGIKKVIIPPGFYRIPALSEMGYHLKFVQMKDFEVEAKGVTLSFLDNKKSSILFDHCDRVTFKGATLLREKCPFSQGDIIAIAEDRKSIDVRIHEGYLDDLNDKNYFQRIPRATIFEPSTRLPKRQCNFIYPDIGPNGLQKKELLERGLYRIHCQFIPLSSPIQVGDMITFRGTVRADIYLAFCKDTRITGVTIKSGVGMAVKEMSGDGGNYFNYTITRGVKPPGATQEPLLSINADGFHSSDVRRGATLEKCLFEFMDDDGIALHGIFGLVLAREGNKLVINTRSSRGDGESEVRISEAEYRVGDRLQFIDDHARVLYEAKITSLEKPKEVLDLPDNAPGFLKNMARCHPIEIRLDREIPVEKGWLLSNNNMSSRGFVIRDCVVRHNSARGMAVKAGDGLIEGCTFEDCGEQGIDLGPQFSWCESEYSDHVVIRNNKLIDNYQKCGPLDQSICGALSVSCFEKGKFVSLPGGHRDILIENNVFSHQSGINILISSAQGVVIRNNRFEAPMREDSNRGYGSKAQINPNALIWITESEGVKLMGNKVLFSGPFLSKFVDVHGSSIVDGIDDGIRSEAR